MIAILDYGAGCADPLVRDADGLRSASKILLPGVGHSKDARLDLRSVRNALDKGGCAYSPVRNVTGVRSASKILLPGMGRSKDARLKDQLPSTKGLL